jgi:hypothetical protein
MDNADDQDPFSERRPVSDQSMCIGILGGSVATYTSNLGVRIRAMRPKNNL